MDDKKSSRRLQAILQHFTIDKSRKTKSIHDVILELKRNIIDFSKDPTEALTKVLSKWCKANPEYCSGQELYEILKDFTGWSGAEPAKALQEFLKYNQLNKNLYFEKIIIESLHQLANPIALQNHDEEAVNVEEQIPFSETSVTSPVLSGSTAVTVTLVCPTKQSFNPPVVQGPLGAKIDFAHTGYPETKQKSKVSSPPKTSDLLKKTNEDKDRAQFAKIKTYLPPPLQSPIIKFTGIPRVAHSEGWLSPPARLKTTQYLETSSSAQFSEKQNSAQMHFYSTDDSSRPHFSLNATVKKPERTMPILSAENKPQLLVSGPILEAGVPQERVRTVLHHLGIGEVRKQTIEEVIEEFRKQYSSGADPNVALSHLLRKWLNENPAECSEAELFKIINEAIKFSHADRLKVFENFLKEAGANKNFYLEWFALKSLFGNQLKAGLRGHFFDFMELLIECSSEQLKKFLVAFNLQENEGRDRVSDAEFMESFKNSCFPDLVHAFDNLGLIVQSLIKQGRVNERNSENQTIAHCLVLSESLLGPELIPRIKYFHSCGLNINAQDNSGNTALHLFIIKLGGSDFDLVKNVIQNLASAFKAMNANFNSVNSQGYTPLHIAAKNGNTEAIKQLILHGANPFEKTLQGDTVLSLVQQSGNKDCIELCNKQQLIIWGNIFTLLQKKNQLTETAKLAMNPYSEKGKTQLTASSTYQAENPQQSTSTVKEAAITASQEEQGIENTPNVEPAMQSLSDLTKKGFLSHCITKGIFDNGTDDLTAALLLGEENVGCTSKDIKASCEVGKGLAKQLGKGLEKVFHKSEFCDSRDKIGDLKETTSPKKPEEDIEFLPIDFNNEEHFFSEIHETLKNILMMLSQYKPRDVNFGLIGMMIMQLEDITKTMRATEYVLSDTNMSSLKEVLQKLIDKEIFKGIDACGSSFQYKNRKNWEKILSYFCKIADLEIPEGVATYPDPPRILIWH